MSDAQVGANEEQHSMNEEREHSGSVTGHQLEMANTFFKKQECCNATYHSTEQRKQLE